MDQALVHTLDHDIHGIGMSSVVVAPKTPNNHNNLLPGASTAPMWSACSLPLPLLAAAALAQRKMLLHCT
jgi:hypothetical protein